MLFRFQSVPFRTLTRGISYVLGKQFNPENRLPLTKIVATIGPASENHPVLPSIVNAGMRIMRINFSHATYEEADLRNKNLGTCVGINAINVSSETNFARRDGRSNMRAVMLDTQGPEIRTGSFADGVKEIELKTGDQVLRYCV